MPLSFAPAQATPALVICTTPKMPTITAATARTFALLDALASTAVTELRATSVGNVPMPKATIVAAPPTAVPAESDAARAA